MSSDIVGTEEEIERDEHQVEQHAIVSEDVRKRDILVHKGRDKDDRVDHEERVPKPFRVYFDADNVKRHGDNHPKRMDEGMPIDDRRAAECQKFRGVETDEQK